VTIIGFPRRMAEDSFGRNGRTVRPHVDSRVLADAIDVGVESNVALALAPSFLRAICSIRSFGNSEIRHKRFVRPIPTKIPTKRTAAVSAPICCS
jgi:hypothetical protein